MAELWAKTIKSPKIISTKIIGVIHLLIVGLMRGVMEREIIHVELEAAILGGANELIDLVPVLWHPKRRHTHHLVLAFVHLKTQKRGKSAVLKPQGVREPNLFSKLDIRPSADSADSDAGGGPLPHPVHRHDRCFLITRTEKSTGGM
jgi:hypothetical protein